MQGASGGVFLKKLSIIALLITLPAAWIFAEIEFSASVGAGIIAAKSSNVIGDTIHAGSSYLAASIEANAQNEKDTFGGLVNISAELFPNSDENTDSSVRFVTSLSWNALVWWKPFYIVKFQMGFIEDFGLTDIIGWGYNANDAENYVVSPKESYAGGYFPQNTGFYGGTGINWVGAALTVNPLYGLYINLAVPFGLGYYFQWDIDENGAPLSTGREDQDNASKVYLFTHAQIVYDLWKIGRFAVSFAGGGDGTLKLNDEYYNWMNNPAQIFNLNYIKTVNASSIYTSFFLTALDHLNLGVNIGFGYTLPAKTNDSEITYYSPVEAGLGVSWGTDSFGVKSRFALRFAGKARIKTGDITLKQPFMLGFGVLPYYKIGPFKIHLNTGISYKFEDEFMDETTLDISKVGNSAAFGWYVNPYVTITVGSGVFFAGFQIESDGLKYVLIEGNDTGNYIRASPNAAGNLEGFIFFKWRIPIGIQFSF